MLPPQTDIEIPLLEALVHLGGRAKSRDVYPLVTAKFPGLTPEELEERLDCGNNKWINRIQWVRQHLIEAGEMESPERGIWAITEQGRKRLSENGLATPKAMPCPPPGLVELHEQYEQQFKSNLLDKLHELTPQQFELFAKKLLTAYGFVKMEVTSVNNDGGIDGHGLLKVGLALMAVAFQCKRWQGNVPRPEVDRFRGAIQGSYEQGIFFTTADFSKGAMEASIKKGAVPIILLNGESIVELMIEKQFGVQRRPLEIYYDQIENLFADEL